MGNVSPICATRRVIEVEALVVGAHVLVIGADDIPPGPFPSVPAMSCCSRFSALRGTRRSRRFNPFLKLAHLAAPIT